ncbi:MAG: protein translocase subunit SecDF [Bacteroidetes bacterium]|nr:protein translocase subunit SecDF [Bacteroidota bacterium]
MQLKGLVRFFTVLLIIYSLYLLSFTFLVKRHERKMEAKAKNFVYANYPESKKFKKIEDFPDSIKKIYNSRLKVLLDSTSDKIITYGINGGMSYKEAKSEELNLGLDLQGGMNVTLEVEMVDLLKSLSNESADPNFLKAIRNADSSKANSDANFISLFIREYRKLEPAKPLFWLFSKASGGKIDNKSSDSQVETYIRNEAKEAFELTKNRLVSRIDQFGVAQPTINSVPDKGIIIVELPGIQDKERVRKNLQSSANLQFWELYNLSELAQGINPADAAFFAKMGGKSADTAQVKKDASDTATNKVDTANAKKDTGLTTILGKDTLDKNKLKADEAEAKKHLFYYVQFNLDQQGRPLDNGVIGYVKTKDTALVRSYLEYPEVRINFPKQLAFLYGAPLDKKNKKAEFLPIYAIKTYTNNKARLEGDVITGTSADYEQNSNNAEIVMRMNTAGAKTWGEMTKENVGRFVAISLDNYIYSAPVIKQPIEGGISSISGSFTIQEAQDLASIIKIGKLPAPARIVQEQQVGPTLGAEALRGGALAFFISFIVIFLLMLVYYNTSGWVANIALILNLLFTVGILTGLGATLTAPGIAGLVLTIGMAVDTNVIIYERIKEELNRGKGYIPAINEGYKRSLPPVLDGHITILLTALILFYFGLGPVKGFATTQIIGILLSLFCGILVSRWVTEWFTNKKKHLEYFTGISKRIFQHAKFKFIEYRKVAYIISIVVLGLGIGSFFNGFDYGVEFNGGRSYTVQFEKRVDVEKTRESLKKAFENESPIIKTIGDDSKLDITTSYLIKDTRKEADSLVLVKLYEGLQNYLPQGTTFEQFSATQGEQSSKKVLPTISDDLKKGALKATLFALLVIFIYIFIRFRDWRYSLGTIVALLHDVFVTLIVFSFARAIVPFPLEIDQHFIAAVLTVIGFSMNDTVIVFDRIREDSRLMPNAPRAEIINRAINETLSRTIMTSLTVFLTILILFIFGGEVTRGFAFAMLIGVITGTYSSIFVAAPILVDLGGSKSLGKAGETPKKS